MPAEIYIVSGFLGAGKTTLIQKLLKEAFQKEKVALIENDFGEISVDAALLKSGGVEVKEINSGCICCSLSGDFVKALKDLLTRFAPDVILIEPSGVGKLSDIVKACSDPRILQLAKVKARITAADVKRCKMYLDNFGEFFEDQIQNADVILLSGAADSPQKVSEAHSLIRGLNGSSVILSKPWDQIRAEEILHPQGQGPFQEERRQARECGCGRGLPSQGEHSHGAAGHDHPGGCCGGHSAEDIFDTVTILTARVFTAGDLKARFSRMEQDAQGTILRAKGILRGPKGYLNLQYLPGDLRISQCASGGDMLCIIGRNLNRRELVSLFSGE